MPDPKAGQIRIDFSARDVFSVHTLREALAGSARTENFSGRVASAQNAETLRKYSITTLEEAIGVARVKPEALSRVVGEKVVEKLRSTDFQNRLAVLNPTIARFPENERRRHAFGARIGAPPPGAPEVSKEDGTKLKDNPVGLEFSLVTDGCMSPIGDQGIRWTCVAFATATLLEYEWCRKNSAKVNLSEQMQYWNCKCNDRMVPPYTSQGTYPDVSFALAKRDGICLEQIWPYNPTSDPPKNDLRAQPALQAGAHYRVRSAVEIQQHRDTDILKRYVRDHHPIAVAIPVYDSWEMSANTQITGNITMPLPDEVSQAGHAFVLVGYEENAEFAGGGYFIVRNSWGRQWGIQSPFTPGYGTLPYQYIRDENHSAFIVRF